jgi:hypothetical protein
MKKGIESLKAAVMLDVKGGNDCFNENGCDHEYTRMFPETNPALIEMGFTQCCKRISKCFHQYCNKYKWIIDRAKYYAEKTGKTFEEIIEIWESNRTYWYMNYYQEGKQPLKGKEKDDKVIEKLNKRIDFLNQEIETYKQLSLTLTYDHQQSTKNDLLKKVDNMKSELNETNARIALYEISCF